LEEISGKVVQKPAEEFPQRRRLILDTFVDCICNVRQERPMTEGLQLAIIQVLLALASDSQHPLHGHSLNMCFVTLYNIYLSTIRFPFFRASKGVMSQMQLIFRCA
jgi:hypothetical protein